MTSASKEAVECAKCRPKQGGSMILRSYDPTRQALGRFYLGMVLSATESMAYTSIGIIPWETWENRLCLSRDRL